jgi:uncharacterized membrane protein YfcA
MPVPAVPPDGEHGRDASFGAEGGRRIDALLGGAVAGLAGGLFGVGGGILLVPILVGRYRLTQHQAHGTSISVLVFTALSALIVYGLHGNVAWGTALLTGIGSMVMVRYGARLASRLSKRGLARSFAVFLVVVAARLFWKVPAGAGSSLPPGLATWSFDLGLGGAIGLLAGFMGVGGGILAVPAFTLLLGMPQALAQGTSLAVILLAAPVGAIEHSRQGNVVWRMVPPLALGAALAAPAASWLAQRLPQAVLARGFAIFLLGNAIWSWRRAGRT